MSLESPSPHPHQRAASLRISSHSLAYGATGAACRWESAGEEPFAFEPSNWNQFVGDLANMVQTLGSAVRVLSARSALPAGHPILTETQHAFDRAQASFAMIRAQRAGTCDPSFGE